MKKNALNLFATILSATTLMSSIPMSSVNAVELSNNSWLENQQLNSTTKAEIHNCCGCLIGDLSPENDCPEGATVIKSVDDYYEITGKLEPQSTANNGAKLTLPSSVDNSASKYFPPVGHQENLGSCATWAQVYYQFGYTMNKELDRAATSENRFSTKWIYNFVNGSVDNGSDPEDVFYAMKQQGCVPLNLLPYDTDFLSWPTDEKIWRTALDYRVKDWQYFETIGKANNQITSADDSDLDAIKTALNNGDILSFACYSGGWYADNLKTISSTPENDKYNGEIVYMYSMSASSAHRMTIVGYNDKIWTDINYNNKVDNGEMGALKIVDSYGTYLGNKGFYWVAYDALNEKSSVSGAISQPSRCASIFSVARIDVQSYKKGANLYLKCTVNTTDRKNSEIKIIAEKDGAEVSYQVLSIAKRYADDDKKYSLNGSTTSSKDATMLFPLDNVIEDIKPENFQDYNWSVQFVDNSSDGYKFTVKDVEIIDEENEIVLKTDGAFPFTLDGSNKTGSMSIVGVTPK